jgi:flagellar hook-associated protein 1 FlgK
MSLLVNGLSGLSASQQMLNVASNNIANINTPGFTRQEGQLVSRSDGSAGFNPGNGVEVSGMRRIADEFSTAALWRAGSQVGYHDKMETLLGQAEGIIGSKSLSISEGVDKFFASLNGAASNPNLTASRQQIIASADSIAGRFNQLSTSLDLQDRQILDEAKGIVKGLNGITENIGKLNLAIANADAKGANTSSLQDQRENLIKELANEVDVRTYKLDDGRINVNLSNGQPLVLGSSASTLSMTAGNLKLDMNGQTFSADDSGGRLGALMDYRNDSLVGMKSDLNLQAETFANDMNSQLAAGFDLNGNPGAALFTYSAPGEAGSLRVSDTITPDELAFIGDDGFGAPIGGPGDNTNLISMVALKDGFYDAFNSLVGGLGIKSAASQAEAGASRSLLESAQYQRDAISSVNQDEEAVKLMTYTQAYQANAKVISTADQIFNTLLGAIR